MALLLAKKVIVPAKNSDFADVFTKKSGNVLSEQTGANKHAIKLEKGNKPPYRLIFSLRLVELKALKTYSDIGLLNSFS